jgi:chromosome segregation ATPase
MSKPDSKAAKKQSAADVPPESLEQVRDILFGGQMRTVETRLKSIEERLSREQEAMRAEFAKRVADLDAFARRETQALHERVAAESDARVAALKSLLADIKEAQKAMDKRHADLAKLVDDLQGAKTDRASLAAMLTDVAARLVDGTAKGAKGAKG